MNIETKVYKAKAEKLMEEVRRLEILLERQESRPYTPEERAALEAEFSNLPEPSEEELIRDVDFSTGPGGVVSHLGSNIAQSIAQTIAQPAVAVGSGLVGAHAVGGYVPTRVGKRLIGTPPQVVRPKPGGFSTQRAVTAGAYDTVKGVIPYEQGTVRLGSMGSGWGTKASEKFITNIENPSVVATQASRVAKQAAEFEKAHNLLPNISTRQRNALAAKAAKDAEAAYRASSRASSDISQTAAKIASTKEGQLAIKGAKALTTLGRKALGKIVTPIGAAVSGWEAYKEFKKGNPGRGLAHSGLAVANLIPGLNLVAIPFEVGMAATEVEESYKGIEVTKKLNEIKNL